MRKLFWLTSITLVVTAVTTLAVADHAHRNPDSLIARGVHIVAGLWRGEDARPQPSKGYEEFKARCCQETAAEVACPNMFPPPQLDVDSGIPAVEELRKIARMEHRDPSTASKKTCCDPFTPPHSKAIGNLTGSVEIPLETENFGVKEQLTFPPTPASSKPAVPQAIRWTGPDGLERVGIDFDVQIWDEEGRVWFQEGNNYKFISIKADSCDACPKCEGKCQGHKQLPRDERELRELAENNFKEWDATLKSLTLGAPEQKCEDCCCCTYFSRIGSRVLSCYCSQMMCAIFPCACMEVNITPREGENKGTLMIGVGVRSRGEPCDGCCKKEACCTKCTAPCKGESCTKCADSCKREKCCEGESCCTKCTAQCKGEKCCESECCHETKLVTRVYPAADLIMVHKSEALSPVGGQANVESLTRILTQTIEPQSWDVNGGAGHLEYYPLGKCFVISQSPAVHAKVGELLEKLHGVVSDLAEQVGRLETPIGPIPMPLPPLPGQPQMQELIPDADGWLTIEAEEDTEIIITDEQGMFLRGSTFRLPSSDGNMKVRVVRKSLAKAGKDKFAEKGELVEPEEVPVPPVEIDDLQMNILSGMIHVLVPTFWQGLPNEWNDPPTCVQPVTMPRHLGRYHFLPPGRFIILEEDIDDCPQLELDLPMLWFCLPMVLF